jgi:release factor glutamine methyltransferase
VQQFELIVSNPPYIDADDPHLLQGDVRFEPRRALIAEQNGLAEIAQIIARAQDYLKPGAWLLFEHGFEQAPAVRTLLSQHAFETISTWNDLGGRERVTGGHWRADSGGGSR